MPEAQPVHPFDEYYYAHNCGQPYARSPKWQAFFASIAARIQADFQPVTVLDAGCAKGFLVEELRSLGIQAWGIDISEAALHEVHPSISAYCAAGSLADPLEAARLPAGALPSRYDLIVCIEVMEHMSPDEAERAIENLCRAGDTILLSSSPLDYKEATHVNVRPPEEWATAFARQGFYRDVDYDAAYITPWAACFRRQNGALQHVLQAYERRLWLLKAENHQLRNALLEAHHQLKEGAAIRQELAEIQHTRSWQFVHALQALRMRLAPPGTRREGLLKKLLGR